MFRKYTQLFFNLKTIPKSMIINDYRLLITQQPNEFDFVR